jgi:cytochrome c2
MPTHTANTQTDMTTLEADMTTENAKHQQERNAANVKANETLLQFVKAVHLIRPTPKSADIGPQLEAIIERAIEDMACYFHDHLRDHYDARKDI